MGGNALKLVTERKSASEYFRIVDEFINTFERVFGFRPVLIKSYHTKESFGDIDFLVEGEKLPHNWTSTVKAAFELDGTTYIKNSNVVTIAYQRMQVDLIVTPAKYMETSAKYFAFNDCSNIIGRILHKLGIKLGHKGISLIIRHKERSDHILKEIELSHRYEDALEILGLDVDAHNHGFDMLEDIFEYVSTSKFFDPEIYAFENRSYTSRVRDKKRATYNGFLKWIEQHPEKKKYSFPDKNERGGYSIREPYYTDIVLKKWPWVEQIVNETIAQFEFSLRVKEKYNGHIIGEMTGLSGKELGAFMAKISALMSDEIKQKIVDSSPDDAFIILQELVNAVTD